jgi:hypothetical protein
MSFEQPDEKKKEPMAFFNNRRETMLRELNDKTGSDHPLTEEGYRIASGNVDNVDNGIIDKLVASGGNRNELINRFARISRTKKPE